MGDLHIPNKQIFQEGEDLVLGECSSELGAVLEVAAFAELGDDVAVVDGGVDVKAADDIEVCQFFDGLYFEGEVFSDKRIGVFIPDIYNFDGNSFFGGLVDASKYVAAFGEVEVIV